MSKCVQKHEYTYMYIKHGHVNVIKCNAYALKNDSANQTAEITQSTFILRSTQNRTQLQHIKAKTYQSDVFHTL